MTKVDYKVEIEPEIASPVAVFGDDVASDIASSLDSSNQWSWCCVTMIAEITLGNIQVRFTSTLGCCSYKNEKDFRRDVYWEEFQQEVERYVSRLGSTTP